MSVTDAHMRMSACPGCDATSLATSRAAGKAQAGDQEIALSLPSMHCAACISTVERGLLDIDGVSSVRVNLTRKRAVVHARNDVSDDMLTEALARLGYDAQPLDQATLSADQSDNAARDILMRLGVSGFAMMNVMLLSVAIWSGASDATRDLFHWISAAIALPTIIFAAKPFYVNAWKALRVARLNMDVPITLAIFLAAGMSLFEVAHSGEHAYFDAALSLCFFLLAGRYLDQRTRTIARSAATELAALEAPTALLLRDGKPDTVALDTLAVGDTVLVRPGARMPIDGEIVDGDSELDRAFLTGESDPIAVRLGDQVRAGEINLTGPLHVRVTAVGKDTFLHALADLIAIAENSKSKYNSLADRAAAIYAPAVHLLAFAAFLMWMYLTGGDLRFSLNIAVATLIITCPCALGLAVPAVSTVASGALFRKGLLVKHATALERLAEVTAVVFDKTGTLTIGQPRLLHPDAIAPSDMAVAAALARSSAHPRSKAIAQAAAEMDLPEVTLTDVKEQAGHGISGQWNGQTVALGRADWVGGKSDGTQLRVGDQTPIALEFEDTLRTGVAELLELLKDRGLPITLLSGDTADNVKHFAAPLGLTDWRAGILPDDKATILKQMTADGDKVLMVGDGLNDTAAMALAHVSIAPASALDATRVAADMVLVAPDVSQIADGLRIAKSARRRILENFGIAACYNAIAVPIAFFGFATPLAAAIAMSSSSIIVSLNALRTR
ncbi:cadmium-translocating P-type ATPase [Octadecabacter sp. CECT 8868]|uniref:heavy metal translocating P-type ATPase n=1 Tax=Octadecabacter algicola TaxID=2909342 RepID=UPI001F281015|nr:heavy metal translocating P-type ATPase [Octadecabacter algicola]MCF2905865.1 cadmium-translocating P-type ATPase [Octadecabacter algicola]